MKIVVLAVGKTTTRYIKEATDEYLKRSSRYINVEFQTVADIRTNRTMSEEMQKRQEAEAILNFLQPTDAAFLLDEKGKQYTSRNFANLLDKKMLQGLKRTVFIIGGPYGFDPSVYEKVPNRISLSTMTFTHEMIRLFFAEQIYRAMTILRGEPYHHD